MKKKFNFKIPAKNILFMITAVLIVLIAAGLIKSDITAPLRNGINQLILPLQNGFNQIGGTLFSEIDSVRTMRQAQDENKRLKEEIADLKEENTRLLLERTELDELRELLNLKNQYSDYEMVGARVIAKDSGNWFHSFTIDKGTEDGIQENMCVIAQGGLVGIVTYAGPTFAKVMSIIDDESNVTAMSATSGDGCIISGDLELYEDGLLRIMHVDKNDVILEDDRIVTSNTSGKYLPGILIGFVKEISVDANNLTQSGTLVPVVNFKHLDTVMVITTLKETGEEPQ